MFSFKPYDDSDVQGRSKDLLPEDLKKDFHFSVHCDGLEELDDLIFVRINENFIQFFRESDKVSEAEMGRVVESISLTNPKDTGYDLLYFAENIGRESVVGKDIIDDDNIKLKLEGFLDRAEVIFEGFPFFLDNKRKHSRNKIYNYDKVFLRLCLLEFLLAVDTHDEIFAIVPNYDKVRKKLRESKVYCLLCAKLRYCMYCYKGRNALNEDEYTFVVSRFSDLLMDGEFNKMVPPSYYDKPRLFNNPEYELRQISRANHSSKQIKDATKEKITHFFLTKHATLDCDFGVTPKVLKVIRFILMAIMVVWMLVSLMCFDKVDSQAGLFHKMLKQASDVFFNTYLFGLLLVVLFVLSVVIIGFKGKIFHSRIIVALLMGWFTIAVSEDLIKSQLELDSRLVLASLVAVLLIVGGMLWGEVRQHSPYYCRWKPHRIKNWPKITVVLVYAMFWNLFFGMVIQNLTYSSLLRTSGEMSNAILGQLPDDVAMYRKTVETCINILDDYDRSMEGVIHDYGEVDFNVKTTISLQDTIVIVNPYTRSADKNQYKNNKTNNEGSFIIAQHDSYFEQIKKWLELAEQNMNVSMALRGDSCWIKKNSLQQNFVWLVFKEADGMKVVIDTNRVEREYENNNPQWSSMLDLTSKKLGNLSNVKADSIRTMIDKNLLVERSVKNDLRMQLLDIDNFMSYMSKLDNLEKWAEVNEENIDIFQTNSYYLAFLSYDVIAHHRFNRKMKTPVINRKPIFPRMLIFHSLIVLIIAFVGQLIVSDKSVTEPL